jgi:hypothetical protein
VDAIGIHLKVSHVQAFSGIIPEIPRKDKKVQRLGYEAHLTIPSDTKYEAGCSSKDPMGPSTDEATLTLDDYMDMRMLWSNMLLCTLMI